jgi:hypothetical protein
MKWIMVLVISVRVLLAIGDTAIAQNLGQFKGEPRVTLMGDGRNVRLAEPFGYVDPNGQHWDVPAGMVTDGASIPRVFWIKYPPFTGNYRNAAIVHDHYCNTQSRSWQDTHNMFYDAMLTAKVDGKTAKILWAAVYGFGPRWGIGAQTRGPAAAKYPTVEEEEKFLEDLRTWIDRSDPSPSLEEIARAVDSGSIPR